MQPVICASAVRLRREAGAVQRAIEEVAGTISRKHASSPIGAMCGRSQAKDQHPGPGIAEGRHGLAPVVPCEVGAPFAGCDLLAVAQQTRAFFTLHNFAIESDKTGMAENFVWNRHEIIMTSGPGPASEQAGNSDKCHRNTLTGPLETRENELTGCSPGFDAAETPTQQPSS